MVLLRAMTWSCTSASALGASSSTLALVVSFSVGLLGLAMVLAKLLPEPLRPASLSQDRRRRAKRLPLPPGPPGEFLLGHSRVVPFEAPFKKYAEWGVEYDSDVLYFSAFGQKWIVLNSLEAAVELLDKRGSNYGDRPRFVLWELMGWAPTLTWLRWGPKMLQHRRALQRPFSRTRAHEHHDAQRREAVRAVASMARRPEAWGLAARRFAVGVVMDAAYGIEIGGDDDRYVGLSDSAAEAIGNAGPPAGSIVDMFPMTRFLPSWLPFMERVRYAQKWKPAIENVTNVPFEAALSDAKRKVMKKCFVRERLDMYHENEESGLPNTFTMDDIKGAAATVLIAGSETTATTVRLFIMYLMQNPRVRRRAQDEIDRVLGERRPGTAEDEGREQPQRLPTWDDLPRLQYLKLVLQEVYRSSPLSPLGIPHASLEDDEYRGMFIPRGTVVYQNVWAMNHDRTVYSDPDTFLPERYLAKGSVISSSSNSSSDDVDGALGRGEPFPTGNFGFGRRVCLGRHLAENSLLIIFATILATLDVGPPRGPDGRARDADVKMSFRGQVYPFPFECSLTPRSEAAMRLLDEAAQ
ncbi:hypothetical protein RB595_008373 [Gaeumannomyces hyphopodioides]